MAMKSLLSLSKVTMPKMAKLPGLPKVSATPKPLKMKGFGKSLLRAV